MKLGDLLNTVGMETLLAALSVVLGGLFALLRWFIARLETGLDKRFEAVEKARIETHESWHEAFIEHVRREEREFEALRNLDRSFMEFRANLPTLYIRRDELRDYLVRLDIRFDGMNEKLNRLLNEELHEEDHHVPP